MLKEALERYGTPEPFNSDQGPQDTGAERARLLRRHGATLTMNGKGRSIDNLPVKRFYRAPKYDEIYLNDYRRIADLRAWNQWYMGFFSCNRFHSALGCKKSKGVYRGVRLQGA